MKIDARGTTLSAAGFVLICFFLPWVQVSCLGMKDSASGLDLARGGDRALWLIPLSMLLVLLTGLVRLVWERMPALFALSGTVGGGLSAYLMYHERSGTGRTSDLIPTFWMGWYWMGFVAALGVVGAALWFYVNRARSP